MKTVIDTKQIKELVTWLKDSERVITHLETSNKKLVAWIKQLIDADPEMEECEMCPYYIEETNDCESDRPDHRKCPSAGELAKWLLKDIGEL